MRLAFTAFFLCLFCTVNFAQRYFPVKIDNRWGLIDANGQLTVEPIYEAIGEFKQFGYAVMQREGNVGLLGKNAEEVISPKYDDLKVLSSGLVAVMKNQEWSVVNIQGKTILPAGYERVKVWDNRFLAYMRDSRWGVVDLEGIEVCPPLFDEIALFENNYWLVGLYEKFGLLDIKGQEILRPEHDEIRIFNENLFFFRNQHKWGLKDKVGQIAAKFDYYTPISNHFIKLKNNGSVWLYSLQTNSIISKGEYDAFFPFSSQYVIARKHQSLALLDGRGQAILSPYYNEIQTYGSGKFRVNINEKWGVVGENDEPVVPFEYDYISPLKNNICVVKKDGKLGVLNAAGKEVVPPEFSKIELKNKRAHAFKGEQLTLLNFTEKGELKDESNFENHFTVSIRPKQIFTSAEWEGETDYVLNDFEWFYSPQLNKWGLRRLSDGGIQIEPTFDNIQVEQDLGLTIVGVEQLNKLDFDRTTYRFEEVYGLVNNNVGLLVKDLNLFDIRLSDFDKGLPVARCIFTNGRHGLINKIGKIIAKDYAFIGEFNDGLARMSVKGKLSGSLSAGKQELSNLQTYLNKHKAPNKMVDFTAHDREFQLDAGLTCEGCRWGYVDTTAVVAIPPQYDFALDMVNRVALVECKGKWGMVAKDAKELLPCDYDNLQFLDNTDNTILRIYKQNEKYGLIDTLGHLQVHLEYDEIGSFSEGRLAVRKEGLWGFTDRNGVEVIPCQFKNVHDFTEGLAAVKIANKWGFIDDLGDFVIQCQYTRAGSFQNGLAPVYFSMGYAYINPEGEVVIPPSFSNAQDFDRGVARVTKDFKQGLIDTLGNFIVRPKFIDISTFNEKGLAIVRSDNDRVRSGIIDLEGNIRTEGFISISAFHEGRAAVRYKDGYGFIDTDGKLVIDADYSKVGHFSEGRAMVQRKGLCGFIDLDGKLVVPCQYSKCLDFSGARAVVYKGYKKGGLIDRTGKVLIEPSVNRLYDFNNGRGLVKEKDKSYIYITEQARFYDGSYEDAREFEHGIAVVKTNGKWGVINQKGIEIIPPKYDRIEKFEKGFARVRIQGFNGLTNLKGELIAHPDYEYITYAGDGVFRVEQGDKVGYFNMLGKWVWDLKE